MREAPGDRSAERDEFLRQVARDAGIPVQQAEPHARAVLQTLRRSLSDVEWEEVCARVPQSISGALAAEARGRRC